MGSGTFKTHDVVNQSPRIGSINLLQTDPLLDRSAAGFSDSVRTDLSQSGAFWGSAEAREFARLSNIHPPQLDRYDDKGFRIDEVKYHPAYHALMRRSVAAGLHCSAWH